jgi:hypothetical protein
LISPAPKSAIHIYRKRVVAFCFEDDVEWRLALYPHYEIRLVIVHLAIVKIGNGEAQAAFLTKESTVSCVSMIGSRLSLRAPTRRDMASKIMT